MKSKKLNLLIEKAEKISGKKIVLKENEDDFDLPKTEDDLKDSLDAYKSRNESFKISEVSESLKFSNYKISKDKIILSFNNDKVKVVYDVNSDKYTIKRKNASGMQVPINIDSKMNSNLRMLLVTVAQEAQEAFKEKKTRYNFGNIGPQGQESYLENTELGEEEDSRTLTDSFGEAKSNY